MDSIGVIKLKIFKLLKKEQRLLEDLEALSFEVYERNDDSYSRALSQTRDKLNSIDDKVFIQTEKLFKVYKGYRNG